MLSNEEYGEEVERYWCKSELPRALRVANPELIDGKFALVRIEDE